MTKKSQEIFVLGLFFLLWATSGYVLFGNLGKYISLTFGVFLTLYSVVPNSIDLKAIKLIMVSFFFLTIYIYISYELNQETYNTLLIIFDFVNLLLFIIGYLLSKKTIKVYKVRPIIIFFISILILISCLKFYLVQTSFSIISGSRDLGDETLNPVGVAYVHAQLFLLITWFLTFKHSLILKIILILTLISIFVIMIITESRGAIIFLGFTILFLFLNNLSIFLKIKNFGTIILIFLVSIILFKNSIISNKIESLLSRFEVISQKSKITDNSVLERKKMYLDFYENYSSMIFGKQNYKPYPHNQFLEIVMRWGIFGVPILLISLISFVKSVRYGFLNQEKQSLFYFVFLIFMFCYLQSMSSLSLDNNRLLWLGFSFFYYKSLKNSQ